MKTQRMQPLRRKTDAHPPGSPSVQRQAGAPDAEDVATYLATLTGELAGMARRSRLPMLAYLLDMAQVEARMAAVTQDPAAEPATAAAA
jgi:hypothetical protein